MSHVLPPPLPSLAHCLEQTSFDLLFETARLYRLLPNKSREISKKELIRLLMTRLGRSLSIRYRWRQLLPADREALLTLRVRHGAIPYEAFTQRFGPFPTSHRVRNRAPLNGAALTTTRLARLGFIYAMRADSRAAPTHVVIPRELLSHFPRPVQRTRPVSFIGAADPTALMTDLTLWLVHLHLTPTARQQGDVPPLATTRTLNEKLRHPADLTGIHRATQAGRTTFLFLLANSLHLADTTHSVFAITPHTWTWLSQSPATRLQTLWDAWSQPDSSLAPRWFHYCHTPITHPDRLTLHDVLLRALRTLRPDAPYPLDSWCRALVRQAEEISQTTPWWEAESNGDPAAAFLQELLMGPLHWLALVALDQDRRTFRLTTWGAWLLRGDPLPAFPSGRAQLRTDFSMVVPAPFDPAALFHLNLFAEWEGPTEEGATLYRLTPASLHRAHTLRYSLATICRHLRAMTATPVPNAIRATLEAWLAQLEPVRLRRVTLLETKDAATLEALGRAAPVRRALRATLHPRAAIVAENELPALLRYFAAQEIPVPSLEPALPLAASARATPAAVGLAVAFFNAIAPRLNLNASLPTVLLSNSLAALDPGTRTAVEQIIAEADANLNRLIDGFAPPPPLATPPPTHFLAVWRAALSESTPTRFYLTYVRVGDDTPCRYDVTPLRIGWDGRVPYLIAWSHTADAERRFRADRLLALQAKETTLAASTPHTLEAEM